MKEGWKYVKLGDCCDFRSGFAFKSNKFTPTGQPIIRISDIQNESVEESNMVYFEPSSYKEDLSKYIIYPNDILIAMSGGTTGKIGINKTNKCFYLNQRVGVFRENDKVLQKKYLYYFLHTKSEESLKIAAGAAQPNLSTAQIKEFVLPLPPLSDQHRIVSYLDTSFAQIDALAKQAEESLENAKALFQATLKELMEKKEGWEEDKLVNVYNFIDYRGATPTKLTSGVPLVTAKNVKYGYIDYTIKDFISQEEYTQRQSRGISKKGDILFTTEAPLGNVALADLDEYSAGQRLITLQQYLKTKYVLSNRFYCYYMLSPVFQKKINELATGATALGIKAKILKEIIVPIPSFEEQERIANTLDTLSQNISQIQSNYTQTLANCQALKQALLRETFE